jgi:H+/Cl- antiporter ClcA
MDQRRELVTDWAMTGLVLAIIALSVAYAFGTVPSVIFQTVDYGNGGSQWYGEHWWEMLALTLVPALMLVGGLVGLALAADDR